MSRQVILATGSRPWEPALVAALGHPASGFHLIRRCTDVPELVAASFTASDALVVVSADLPRLSAQAVHAITSTGRTLVALVDTIGDDQERSIRERGVRHVLPVDAGDIGALVIQLGRLGAPVVLDNPDALPTSGSSRGRLVAVWGTPGAPGRTSIAVAVADRMARAGRDVLLVDADTQAPSLAATLGLLDPGSGLARSARLADAGQLDAHSLAQSARRIDSGLRVLTGLTAADRWPEVGPAALDSLERSARDLAELAVADCGPMLDADLGNAGVDVGRTAATRFMLQRADLVLLVASADPVGISRLVVALGMWREFAEEVGIAGAPIVVLNSVRPFLAGRNPVQAVAATLADCGIEGIELLAVPHDRGTYDLCLRDGRTPQEVSRRADCHGAHQEIVNHILARLGLAQLGSRRTARGPVLRRFLPADKHATPDEASA